MGKFNVVRIETIKTWTKLFSLLTADNVHVSEEDAMHLLQFWKNIASQNLVKTQKSDVLF